MIFNTKLKMLDINFMYAKIMKSKIGGKNMMAIIYDDDKIPIKTVHFGEERYGDYTVAPHDEDKKRQIYLKTQSC